MAIREAYHNIITKLSNGLMGLSEYHIRLSEGHIRLSEGHIRLSTGPTMLSNGPTMRCSKELRWPIRISDGHMVTLKLVLHKS
jgi:hypothetical protein